MLACLRLLLGDPSVIETSNFHYRFHKPTLTLTMLNPIYSITFSFALLLTQVTHALPQASPSTPMHLRVTSDNTSDNFLWLHQQRHMLQWGKRSCRENSPFPRSHFRRRLEVAQLGWCWNATGVLIPYTAIDTAGVGFNATQAVVITYKVEQQWSIRVRALVTFYWLFVAFRGFFLIGRNKVT